MTDNALLPVVSRRSTYSDGNCVEAARLWRKSSHSGASGGECVEVAEIAAAQVPVRDSKDVARGHLVIPTHAWAGFTDELR